jgi:hypothetical protein
MGGDGAPIARAPLERDEHGPEHDGQQQERQQDHRRDEHRHPIADPLSDAGEGRRLAADVSRGRAAIQHLRHDVGPEPLDGRERGVGLGLGGREREHGRNASLGVDRWRCHGSDALIGDDPFGQGLDRRSAARRGSLPLSSGSASGC